MIDLTRRRLFVSGALAGMSSILPAGVARAQKPSSGALTRSRFSAEVGRRFTLSRAGKEWTATLTKVGDLQPLLVAADERRFAVTFELPAAGLGDGVYRLSRPGFTATELFLVADPSRLGYVGIVNRLR